MGLAYANSFPIISTRKLKKKFRKPCDKLAESYYYGGTISAVQFASYNIYVAAKQKLGPALQLHKVGEKPGLEHTSA